MCTALEAARGARSRLGIAAVAAVAIVSAALPVSLAAKEDQVSLAAKNDPSAPTRAPGPPPNAIQDAQQEEAQAQAERQGPVAAKERTDSRTAYTDVSPAEGRIA